MSLTPREFLIREVLERVADLLCDRERAITVEQYQTHSGWIQDELARIEQPCDGWFAANINALREPWVQALEKVLEDIGSHAFQQPFVFGQVAGSDVLFIRTGHIVAHLSHCDRLKDFWASFPVQSDRSLKRAMLAAGVLLVDADGHPRTFEKKCNPDSPPHTDRTGYMVGIRLSELWRYGLGQLAADLAQASMQKP